MIRISLSSDQVEATRALAHLFDGEAMALIGAAALGCWIPLRKKTEDIDFVVMTRLEPRERLVTAGWRRHRTKEHEWTAPNGVVVDIVPTTPRALAERSLTWPESGLVMNLTGLRLVFETGTLMTIANGLDVIVPTVPVIALLKMLAYLDRQARTSKDLTHLATIFDLYPSRDDERMFTAEQADAGLSPEEASVQVLGRELGSLIDEHERMACERFIHSMRNDPTHEARLLGEMEQPRDDRGWLLTRRLEILADELRAAGTKRADPKGLI